MTETARELWWPHHPSRDRATALAALDRGDVGEVTLEYADFVAIADLLDDAVKALEHCLGTITCGMDGVWDHTVRPADLARAALAKLRSKT
ncbi:hypothetical protein J7354_01630 [Sulfitobacter sp. R18_2]|uniref:hypothetical protein n=1 Tax=Sulfitobacter sp. R18_2 TaxID=2821105 RepID=UPI001ADC266D|nr:hypothetical protein [Sulfitobacter sp. R18_2]MBO9437351.1 hypothetical protein [Sulfitobacter sp. R18_2]